jgi:hypothetical protein
MQTKIHKFEAAGLGKAPFRFEGCETRTATPSCPNPSTSCDYCGTGIVNVFWIRSADGKRSKVGCDCIRKHGDSGLVKIVSEAEAAKRREANAKRRQAKWKKAADDIARAKAALADVSGKLAGLPHPVAHHAAAGRTLLDYVSWLFDNRYDGKAADVVLAHVS